jgi:hypothetical protein
MMAAGEAVGEEPRQYWPWPQMPAWVGEGVAVVAAALLQDSKQRRTHWGQYPRNHKALYITQYPRNHKALYIIGLQPMHAFHTHTTKSTKLKPRAQPAPLRPSPTKPPLRISHCCPLHTCCNPSWPRSHGPREALLPLQLALHVAQLRLLLLLPQLLGVRRYKGCKV